MKKQIKIAIIAVTAVAVAAASYWGWKRYSSGKSGKVVFHTEEVKRSDIMSVINASGTVEPEELVNVGAQVSGKIMSFGNDADGKTVDYGSRVTKGMILAKIDEVLYEAALSEAKAGKAKAEVAILSARANIQQANPRIFHIQILFCIQ